MLPRSPGPNPRRCTRGRTVFACSPLQHRICGQRQRGRLAADVTAFTGKDATGYFMTGLGRHADLRPRMTADIVPHCTLPEHELQREREVIRRRPLSTTGIRRTAPKICLAVPSEPGVHGMPVIGSLDSFGVLYNRTRRHSHLGDVSRRAFERAAT